MINMQKLAFLLFLSSYSFLFSIPGIYEVIGEENEKTGVKGEFWGDLHRLEVPESQKHNKAVVDLAALTLKHEIETGENIASCITFAPAPEGSSLEEITIFQEAPGDFMTLRNKELLEIHKNNLNKINISVPSYPVVMGNLAHFKFRYPSVSKTGKKINWELRNMRFPWIDPSDRFLDGYTVSHIFEGIGSYIPFFEKRMKESSLLLNEDEKKLCERLYNKIIYTCADALHVFNYLTCDCPGVTISEMTIKDAVNHCMKMDDNQHLFVGANLLPFLEKGRRPAAPLVMGQYYPHIYNVLLQDTFDLDFLLKILTSKNNWVVHAGRGHTSRLKKYLEELQWNATIVHPLQKWENGSLVEVQNLDSEKRENLVLAPRKCFERINLL